MFLDERYSKPPEHYYNSGPTPSFLPSFNQRDSRAIFAINIADWPSRQLSINWFKAGFSRTNGALRAINACETSWS